MLFWEYPNWYVLLFTSGRVMIMKFQFKLTINNANERREFCG